VRISKDPKLEALGVKRQEKECREKAASLGWSVERVYTDNDKSAFAYVKGKESKRGDWLELLDDIQSGKVKRVVAWDSDRITRQPREMEPFIDLVQEVGCLVATVTGEYDPMNSDGRMMIRIKGAMAARESEHKSERVRSKFRELIESGKGHGGPRPFGWESDGVTQRKDEIDLLIDAKNRILNGSANVWTICNEWQRNKVKSSKGGTMAVTTLRKILLRPRVIGQMSHRDGIPIGPGAWEPIFTREEWLQLGIILRNGGKHRTSSKDKDTAAYLLTGIVRCGVCGGRMFGAAPVGARKVPVYRCNKAANTTNCGKTHIKTAETDQEVMTQLTSYLTSYVKRSPKLFGGESTAMSAALLEVSTIEGRIKEYVQMGVDGSMEPRHVADALRGLQPKLKAAQDAMAQAQASNSGIRDLAALDATNFLKTWERKDTAERRKVLMAVGATVTIHPHVGPRRNPSLKPRVEVGFTVFDLDTIDGEA
jgi:DNA invertase Pin-like site-specific DNA recombinase